MMSKKMFAIAVAIAGLPAVASAELTGNIGASSDYVWRGLTQTAGDAAVSGGMDYNSPFGLSAGMWTSNTAFGSPELDLYAGYSKSFGDFSISAGYIGYLYPGTEDDPATADTNEANDLDWTEASVGFGWKMLSLTYNFSNDTFNTGTKSSYVDLGASFEVAKDLTLALHVGRYDFENDDVNVAGFVWDDYIDYSISLSAGDFSITYSDTDLPDDTVADAVAYGSNDFYAADDGYKVFVTYSKSFTLLK
ncbi:MAG: TorF family putative porin [Gammaproteobacteria bacterium]|nr:TorF family putative porin [Gammaproteobacteria bacterium]